MKKSTIIALFGGILISSICNAEWKQLFTQMGNKNVWAGVEVFDENNISMPGIMESSGNSQPVLGYSSDGQNIIMGQPPTNTDAQMSIFLFVSGAGTNGFLAGISLLKGFPPPVIIDVAKSNNKGKSYTISKNALPGSKNFSASAIYFSDPLTGWIVGRSDKSYYLAYTKDGGTSWTENTSFYTYKQDISINNIFFINDRIGWIVGGDNGEINEQTGEYTRNPSSGFVAVSTDGGKTFKNIYENTNFTINSIHFLDCQNGIIAGYDATKAYVLYTRDGGKTFTSGGELKIPFGNKTSDATFVSTLQLLNTNEGFLAANYLSDTKTDSCVPGVFKTLDGGKSWQIDDTYYSSLSGFAKYACIHGMRFFSERVGYVVGQHMLVAKYTNNSGSSDNNRCVECMLGKCHKQEILDAGFDTTLPDISYPDGQTVDITEDIGPIITCPSDKVLPITESKICFKDSTMSSLKSFKENTGFAEIINGTSFVAYVIGEKEGTTLGQARDAANNKTKEIDYIKLSISPSMKVSEMYGYAGLSFTGSNISAQIVYDDTNHILMIKGLEGDIIGEDGQKKAVITIDIEIPVLNAKQLSNVSKNQVNEICNLNRLPCSPPTEDVGIVIVDDGKTPTPSDTYTTVDIAHSSDTLRDSATSDGCSCTTLF
ncbi:MAG: hypothetical protein N2746_04445 [Deltaproteobacteria bacterium]|nr:hypothetical protein [Deltaproteobacteria bacterium]